MTHQQARHCERSVAIHLHAKLLRFYVEDMNFAQIQKRSIEDFAQNSGSHAKSDIHVVTEHAYHPRKCFFVFERCQTGDIASQRLMDAQTG
jgi:hypothetical protein